MPPAPLQVETIRDVNEVRDDLREPAPSPFDPIDEHDTQPQSTESLAKVMQASMPATHPHSGVQSGPGVAAKVCICCR